MEGPLSGGGAQQGHAEAWDAATCTATTQHASAAAAALAAVLAASSADVLTLAAANPGGATGNRQQVEQLQQTHQKQEQQPEQQQQPQPLMLQAQLAPQPQHAPQAQQQHEVQTPPGLQHDGQHAELLLPQQPQQQAQLPPAQQPQLPPAQQPQQPQLPPAQQPQQPQRPHHFERQLPPPPYQREYQEPGDGYGEQQAEQWVPPSALHSLLRPLEQVLPQTVARARQPYTATCNHCGSSTTNKAGWRRDPRGLPGRLCGACRSYMDRHDGRLRPYSMGPIGAPSAATASGFGGGGLGQEQEEQQEQDRFGLLLGAADTAAASAWGTAGSQATESSSPPGTSPAGDQQAAAGQDVLLWEPAAQGYEDSVVQAPGTQAELAGLQPPGGHDAADRAEQEQQALDLAQLQPSLQPQAGEGDSSAQQAGVPGATAAGAAGAPASGPVMLLRSVPMSQGAVLPSGLHPGQHVQADAAAAGSAPEARALPAQQQTGNSSALPAEQRRQAAGQPLAAGRVQLRQWRGSPPAAEMLWELTDALEAGGVDEALIDVLHTGWCGAGGSPGWSQNMRKRVHSVLMRHEHDPRQLAKRARLLLAPP